MSERRVFIEIHPFHAVTLFPYYASTSTAPSDAVFAHERLFGQELFDAIPAPKLRLSFFRLVAFLWRHRIQRCHFNTINTTLNPITLETTRLTLLTLLLPLVTRACGCRNDAIVHEADQFYATGIDSCRRNSWFRAVIGRWFIRLFDRKYVLAPEVAEFLRARNIDVMLLESQPLSRFARPGSSPVRGSLTPDRTVLCWIGPMVRSRKNWRPLAELDAARLEAMRVSIVMLCDINVGEGPEFRKAIREQGLDNCFVFLDHRPEDDELFSCVHDSDGIVCLYGGPEYGTIKSSGARLIASAFRKPFIGTAPTLGVYDHDGNLLRECRTLDECIEHTVHMQSNINGRVSPISIDSGRALPAK